MKALSEDDKELIKSLCEELVKSIKRDSFEDAYEVFEEMERVWKGNEVVQTKRIRGRDIDVPAMACQVQLKKLGYKSGLVSVAVAITGSRILKKEVKKLLVRETSILGKSVLIKNAVINKNIEKKENGILEHEKFKG